MKLSALLLALAGIVAIGAAAPTPSPNPLDPHGADVGPKPAEAEDAILKPGMSGD